MSHRVITQTDMKNKDLAIQAAKDAGITATEQGKDSLRFSGGGMNNAVLDLSTGRITGDSDYGHTSEKLGMLRQNYGEAAYRQECLRQGVSIESRTVQGNGDVVLMWSAG